MDYKKANELIQRMIEEAEAGKRQFAKDERDALYKAHSALASCLGRGDMGEDERPRHYGLCLGEITMAEKELVKHLCPYDLDSCVPCTYYKAWGCPCRGQTEESEAIIMQYRGRNG